MKYRELKIGDQFVVCREKDRQVYTKLKQGCSDGERVWHDYFPTTRVETITYGVYRKGDYQCLIDTPNKEEAQKYIKGKENYLEVRAMIYGKGN